MQSNDVKQAYGLKLLKWLAAAMLVPVLGVPATKLAESYYDVSFFSPAIAGLWNWILSVGTWLGQPVSVQLWLLLTIAICTVSTAVALVRVFRDSNREREAKDAILDATYARIDAAISEIDSLDEELGKTRVKLDTAELELAAALAKVESLLTPKMQPLSEHQRTVIAGITTYDNADKECYVKDLCQKINFTMVQTDGAVDVLLKRKLIEEYYTNGGRVVSLTPDGRAYVLDPDFDMPSLTSR
ncbi:hypothetical protein [Pseudomonas sp. ZB1P45]|uniref:hypothetical protein n=1 Tax=Pseudomonas frigoris TaxID=3398356 RepID=UPI0039F11A9B